MDHLGIGRLDLDDLFFDDDGLLFGRLEIAGRLRLGAQTLDGIQDRLLLRDKSVSKFLRPIQFIVHHGQHLGKIDQRFHARIPTL